jgi:hypothetical protein
LSVVERRLCFCDGFGASRGREEESLRSESGGEVRWWKFRGVVEEIVFGFVVVVVVGEGGVEMVEGVRW